VLVTFTTRRLNGLLVDDLDDAVNDCLLHSKNRETVKCRVVLELLNNKQLTGNDLDDCNVGSLESRHAIRR
jgi:hypothetical protein